MSSELPRARIDQFFSSRKRRIPPPRDEKSASPGTKGTLETYLVKSPDPVPSTESYDRPIRDPVKRNLTKEIGLDSDAEPGGGNPELKQFASDFLSLYCGDLAVEKDSKEQKKRNGSPSLLKNCSKKQRVSDESENCSKPVKLDLNDAASGLTLRKCSKTPDSSLIKAVGFAGVGFVGVGDTPQSMSRMSRSSMFSPGEDFWNEAIQVADGLYVPGDKLLQDKSSCAANPGARNMATLKDDGFRCEDRVLDGFVKPREPEVVKLTKASPLPVKHFDFSHEGNIISRESSDGCLQQKLVVDVRSINKNPVHSDDQKEQEDCEEKPKSDDPCLPNERLAKVAEKGSEWSTNGGKTSLLTRETGNNFVLNDKTTSAGPLIANRDSSLVASKVKTRSSNNVGSEQTNTPSSSMPVKDHLQLNSWLPSEICNIYMKKGISKLYSWQVDCLLVDGVLEKRNLVYCASTSAGKSFVAEILMLRRIISTGKIALLVLPYVSICVEKAEHLEALLEPLGKHVRSFYGSQGGGSLPKDTSVAVCTIEKANSLINKLLEEGRLSEVAVIVIDELHMVADQHRGYLLELILTKLRYAAGEGNGESRSGDSSGSSSGKADPAQGLQIVGMSATMPNVAAVADWLQAALYQTDFRPVPLEEYIKVGNNIFDKKMNVVRMIPQTANLGGKDPDHIVELCNEVVQDGHSVLLFCSSRKGCESTAKHISRFLKKFPIGMRKIECDYDDASSALEALRRCPAGLDPVLEETLPSGVAYHHAGLTVEEREIIETCYRKGIVRVLTATSTLAAGVNLPARRVIFRQPRIGRDFIDGTRYRQMAGRAGRTGIDTKGESILICKPDEVKRVAGIINDSCPPLQSCLSEDKNGMTHAILEVVAGGIVQTASDIHRYVRCTLLNSTRPFEDVVKSAQDSLRWLCHKKFVEWNEETVLYSTTPLGRSAFGSSLTPEESLVVLDDLLRAREGFVLASDLHLVYLVTPINVEVEPDWELYYERFMQLTALDQSVGNRVGVTEPFLMRMAHGAPMHVRDRVRGKKTGLSDKLQKRSAETDSHLLSGEQTLRVSRRFYVALMLARLVQEVPVTDVCESFKVARGMIQALQENAGRFASMVSVFCERLGWNDLEGLVAKFQNRVSFGVRAEIVELTTIPHVKGSRARALYKAGLRTPLAIAEASTPEIAKALFESSSWAGQEGSALRRVQMGVAKKIKNGARKIVLDQAEEARLAAFSAFKSLGVDVPQISHPYLVNVSEKSFTQGGMAFSGEDVKSCFDVTAVKSTQVSPRSVGDAGNKVCNNNSQERRREEMTETTNIYAKVLREENYMGERQRDCNTTIAQSIKEANICPSVALPKNVVATSGETGLPVLNAGNDSDMLGMKFEPAQREKDNGRRNDCSYYNGNITDKGPINACTFPGGFDCFLDHWEVGNEFYFDLHYSKRSELHLPVLFEVLGLAICWDNSPVYYVNITKDLVSSDKLCANDVKRTSGNDTKGLEHSAMWNVAKSRWNRIAKIMGHNGVRKITWDLKSQIQVLKVPYISVQRFGRVSFVHKELNVLKLVDGSFISLPPIFVHDGIDICLVAWMLWPDEESKSTPNLEKVVKKRLSNEDAAAANRSGRWRNQMRKAAHDGCCRRVAQSRALGSVLWKLLTSEGLAQALTRIENPVVGVLADMELWGIGVDMEGCLRARHILVRKLKELEKEAHGLAGMPFSLNTAADIAHVLYTCLKLPIPSSSKSGKLHPSTNKHSLDLLRGQHPIISIIKEHRTLAKLLNCTLGSISSRARLCTKSQKYIVHGHWLQTSTATGRLSMEEPNLQCVEHLVAFTTHHPENNLCSSDVNHHEINARDFFTPTKDNWLLLTADYSQIELRLMAHFSRDTSLVELLSKPDGDCFTMIAARWTGKMESMVSSSERDQTKRLVYGILYGMGANSLAEQLGCCSEEAAEKIQSFKTSFPGVTSWLHEAVASCRHKGFIETLMGRKRFLSKIKFGNSKEKAKAQRQAVNSICQGSAADIIKIAMVKIYSVISEESQTCNMGNEPACNMSNEPATKFSMLKGRCRILLQVHDELVLEVDPSLSREAGMLLQISMEKAVSLLVPLRVKLMVGRTWGSLETFQLEP